MSLSSAAVSPQRARSSRSAGADRRRRVARLQTLLALRALAGDRFGITIPAPDLKLINRSVSAAQPFNPQRVALGLAETACALGAWERRMLDRSRGASHAPGDPWPTRRGRKTGPTVTTDAAALALESASKAAS